MLLVCAATSVSAASYTFDLQLENTYHATKGDAGVLSGNTLTITETGAEGPLTGTFTGKYIVDPAFSGGILSGSVNDAIEVERHNNGLGVCNIGTCASRTDPFHTVDGISRLGGDRVTDLVEMAFSVGGTAVDVTLESLTFGWVGDAYGVYQGTNGSFDLLVSDLSDSAIDAGAILAFSGLATATPGALGGTDFIDLPELPAFTDNLFGVKAGINGSWKLMAATVSYDVPEIPLPAAGWLLLGGLGGLAALKRHSKKA